MKPDDLEIEQLKAGVNCAALLERLPPFWRLDRKESTRHCLKYRRGEGEILIVNHEGRGWWDPQSDRKGDAFSLVQYLDPTLNFGQARQVLRQFTGLAPAFPECLPRRHRRLPEIPIPERWASRARLQPRSPAWRYLNRARFLPVAVLHAAIAADMIREGAYGSAWFVHRDDDGDPSHVEIRGPGFRSALAGGRKTLFRLDGGPQPIRLALAEAPIDALSLAAWEEIRADTIYAASGGGMGPGTIDAICTILHRLAGIAGAELASAADADRAGERYAAWHEALANSAGVPFTRLAPPVENGDWNDALKRRRAA
jgi:Protein of unknown function (DUF3991)/Toprim-like